MTIVLCDDDARILKEAKNLIASFFKDTHTDIICLDSAGDFSDYFSCGNSADVIVMDIELDNGANGIELIKEISKHDIRPRVIYLTGHIEYASPVYETEHEYFVLKTQLDEYLPKALEKAVKNMDKQPRKLYVESRFLKALIDYDDILYIERNMRKTRVVCQNAEYETSEKLDAIIDRLDKCFIRCHVSYIVNMRNIKKYSNNEFIMNNGDTVNISRTYKKQTDNNFLEFIRNRVYSD